MYLLAVAYEKSFYGINENIIAWTSTRAINQLLYQHLFSKQRQIHIPHSEKIKFEILISHEDGTSDSAKSKFLYI
jgi:hypothetical protein